MMNHETDTAQHVLYCSISSNSSQPTKVQVKHSDDIDTIKKEIKRECHPCFETVAAFEIELYPSSSSGAQPLDSREEWNTTVPWGTKHAPVIIKINQFCINRILLANVDALSSNEKNIATTDKYPISPIDFLMGYVLLLLLQIYHVFRRLISLSFRSMM
jgi:hypothetical protein